jgi:hypothetical protein
MRFLTVKGTFESRAPNRTPRVPNILRQWGRGCIKGEVAIRKAEDRYEVLPSPE